jgi:HEAT repeat protein
LKGLLKEPGLESNLKVSILARLANVAKESRAARAALKAMASSTGESAAAARYALADLGDGSVKPALLGALGFGSSSGRLAAAAALLTLGEDPKVAPLLGDRSRDTRVKAACLVLAPRPR